MEMVIASTSLVNPACDAEIAGELGIGRGTAERAFRSLSQNPLSQPTIAGQIS
jgi:hypothetical protein